MVSGQMGPMECRIKMSSGRERVPRLAGGGASVPADSLGMAERHRAAGNCGSLDRMSLSRQLTDMGTSPSTDHRCQLLERLLKHRLDLCCSVENVSLMYNLKFSRSHIKKT